MHLPISDKIELNILHQNTHQAEINKVKFNSYNLLCLNIMSSPGAGKTRLLEITLEDLSKKFHSAVLEGDICLLYTSPSPRDRQKSRMPSSA